jgi:radical SAM superfamily enzyme
MAETTQQRYYDLNRYFRRRFGARVHKISVDAGLTCPNRDGTRGYGGCIYCNFLPGHPVVAGALQADFENRAR